MVGRPADRRHVGIAVVALAGQRAHQPGETIQHFLVGGVDCDHRHGGRRSVPSHVALDAGDGLAFAGPPRAEDTHLEAWDGPREHRPAVARVAIAGSEGIDAELLHEGHGELDAEPRADEGERRVATPSLHTGTGGVHHEGYRGIPDDRASIRTTGQAPMIDLVTLAGVTDTFKTRAKTRRRTARRSTLVVVTAPDSRPPRPPAGTATTGSAYWDGVSERIAGRYYHDAIIGGLKRDAHLKLIGGWCGDLAGKLVLKTDLFEEAHGPDQLLFDLAGPALRLGIDISPLIARRAAERGRADGSRAFECLAADVLA